MARRNQSFGAYVKITEDRDFAAQITALSVEGRKMLAATVFASAERVATDAKRRVRVSNTSERKAHDRPGPGELRDSIRAERGKNPDSTVAFVRAGMGNLRRGRVAVARQVLRAKTTKGKVAALGRLKRLASASRQTQLGVYAAVVEYGDATRRRPAEPYLRPAVDAEQRQFVTAVARTLDLAAQRAGQAG